MRNPLLGRPALSSGRLDVSSPLVGLLVHGRGQSAAYMFDLMERIGLDLPCVAPDACDSSWYPQGFMAPREANQPYLDWALERIDSDVRQLESQGWPRERIALIGFSQGACLATEYVFRNPGRWAALIAFTGGLIGPEGIGWDVSKGDFDGMAALFSNGDRDPWVPWSRVLETAEVFRAMNAAVDLRHYPGRAHLVDDDEIAAARQILAARLSPVAT